MARLATKLGGPAARPEPPLLLLSFHLRLPRCCAGRFDASAEQIDSLFDSFDRDASGSIECAPRLPTPARPPVR